MSKLSENGRRRVYRVLWRVAQADKRIHPAEVEALARMRTESDLSEAEVRARAKRQDGAVLGCSR